MFIQFHSDNNINTSEEKTAPFSALITKTFNRFSHQITSVQVHFTDENGKKTGKDDIRCVMEARLEGMEPIAVTAHGEDLLQAVRAAAHKLESALDTRRDRLRTY